MSLTDEARNRNWANSRTSCKYQELKKANPSLYAELVDATISTVPVPWIADAIRERGAAVSPSSIYRHRKNQCSLCGVLNES